jgi:hypothetical protein
MLLWIYPILASRFATRFVTILGKKREPKGNNHWRKTEIEASLDLILIWWKERENCYRERGEKGALKRRSEKAMPIWSERDRTELSRTTKHGLVLSHAVPFYQLHAMRPHTTWPHTSARKRSTKRESSRPTSFWGFQTTAWEKLRKN